MELYLPGSKVISFFMGLSAVLLLPMVTHANPILTDQQRQDPLDGYEARAKKLDEPVDKALEAARAKPQNTQWTNPLDSTAYRFGKNLLSEPLFYAIMALDLGKDGYIIKTAISNSRRLKLELSKAQKISLKSFVALADAKAWSSDVSRIKGAVETLIADVEKSAAQTVERWGNAGFQQNYENFKQAYTKLQIELNAQIAKSTHPKIKSTFGPWETIDTLEERFRTGELAKMHGLRVAEAAQENVRDLKTNRLELESKRSEAARTRTENRVQEAGARIKALAHRRGGWKWRTSVAGFLGFVVLAPKVAALAYAKQLDHAYQADLASTKRILEETSEASGNTARNLWIDFHTLALRKTIILVWEDFFNPLEPHLPGLKGADSRTLLCPINTDAIEGDISHLHKVHELQTAVIKEIEEEDKSSGKATEGAMVWTQEGIRTFSQRFFTKVFTRLLEEQKSLKQIYLEASDGNSTKFEELVTSLADAAFEEFVDVKINHIEKGIRGTQIPAESESGETPNPNSLEKPQGTSTN